MQTLKDLKIETNYLQKGIIKNRNVIITRKTFYDQVIDSYIK